MDASKICHALELTLQPDPNKTGEKALNEMHKIIGFTPMLLKIAVDQSVSIEIKQAAVLSLKNNINKHWSGVDTDAFYESKPTSNDVFVIHEDDKVFIRQHIIQALVSSPCPIQIQLKSALETILQNDYPKQYDFFFQLLKEHLFTSDYNSLNGALLAIHAFFKRYEFSKRETWLNADAAMRDLLPTLTELIRKFRTDNSEQSLTLQKMILKSLRAYSSFHFNPDTFNNEYLSIWIEILLAILRDNNTQYDDQSESVYWKNKKWAINFIANLFDRYGNPGSVRKSYKKFAEFFIKAYTGQVLQAVFDILLGSSYQSPRVKAACLIYLTTALSQSVAWCVIKPKFEQLLQQVIHPLLCHSEEDEELWQEDPNEFIRYRCVDIDSEQNPTFTAFAFIESASSQRKGILQLVMSFCLMLFSQGDEKQKDGALHIVGAISPSLLKRKQYKNQLETFLVNFVFPTLRSPLHYRRARACWLISKLAGAVFHNTAILAQAITAIHQLMMHDPESPVQVFAATALIHVCAEQEKAREVLKPSLCEIFMKLIDLLRQTEFDDLNELMSTLISLYCDDLQPIAVNLVTNIMGVVNNFLATPDPDHEGGEMNDMRAEMIDSALSNVEIILSSCGDHQEILDQTEPVIVNCLHIILQKKQSELYESIFGVFHVLQSNKISALQWQVVDWMHEAWQDGLGDFMDDTAWVLHQYITCNPEELLAQPERMSRITEMLLHSLANTESELDDPTRAAKLLECMVLQFGQKMAPWVPKMVETAIVRYLKAEQDDSELHIMCLLLIAALILECPEATLPIIASHPWPGSEITIFDQFLQLLLEQTNNLTGLHDRRIFVLVLCKLLTLSEQSRPPCMNKFQSDYVPKILQVLAVLPSMYNLKALEDKSDDESDDEDDDDEEKEAAGDDKTLDEGMASDEDCIDEQGQEYLDVIENGFEGDGLDETANLTGQMDELSELEEFETTLDVDERDHEEFVNFYQTMLSMEHTQPNWYAQLIGNLQEEQKSQLGFIAEVALKTIKAKESKEIEKAGGYDFKQTTVPMSFNFSHGK